MIVYPTYYPTFRCIAGACKHNCCIGWEIDIDDETYGRYRSVEGDFGKRLNSNIDIVDGVPSFRLGEGERCPFLNEDNLCDVIFALGEDALCEICRMHPRYRSFYTAREELGLGLACEEAARLLLSCEDGFKLQTEMGDCPNDRLGDGEEVEFFRLRKGIFAMLGRRGCSVYQRMKDCLEGAAFLPLLAGWSAWRPVFESLEILDPSWTERLLEVQSEDWLKADAEMERWLELACSAFVYRHLGRVLEGDSPEAVLGFCFLSTAVIGALWQAQKRRVGALSLADAAELLRAYSSEIEYSTENTTALVEACGV